MPTFLFDEIIFGPVSSRRLGISLGINLLPTNRKVCSFDCIYCECGFNPGKGAPAPLLPTRPEVRDHLEAKLQEMSAKQQLPDVITFAGNGEPTLHPHFPGIIDDTLQLRDRFCPKARVAVLSNATRLHSPAVFDALLKVDDNIQKLDSGIEATIRVLDQPQGHFDLAETVEHLQRFKGQVSIQTLFVSGYYQGNPVDNSSDEEVGAWLQLIRKISPKEVMIYTIARETPIDTLIKTPAKRLHEIAEQVQAIGIQTQVSE
ncbi:radical SAM protein [Geofilum rubicundum]|uniref:Fe-S oxidoreductase n=1 Tax=Geofilum rubicundum JCM 15548 TaxID=1236989 RepID=A0A0E9LRR4_9BACT|nr:radical SAM protein [Geofilum rubicundum]GAO27968.1 Fe-S oxidoreductase [Geofilum rubicundum JCM 15548]